MWAPNCEWVPVILVHSIKTRVFNHSTCMFNRSTLIFNHSTRVFKFAFDRHRFTRTLTWVACIANTLRVLISRYMLTWALCLHYLSSSNSTVNVRIGNHICKGRWLILLVTGPCKNQPFECKLHWVLFSLISSNQNAVSHFWKLQKKAHYILQ